MGDLTPKGVTRPITLSVNLGAAGVASMTGRRNSNFFATGPIRRSEFGLIFIAPVFSDEVLSRISAAFVKDRDGGVS